MIEVLNKAWRAPDGAGVRGCLLTVRINGKPRVRTFLVTPAYGSVKEARAVGRKPHLWCAVRDEFLAGELSSIAECVAIAASSVN